MKIHIDTDFAGDTDDACAVGLVLGSDGVDLIAATTVSDHDGMRAGYLDHFLRLAGRRVPVAAGAGLSLTTGRSMGGLPDHSSYWGSDQVAPLRSSEDAAVHLLEASVEAGATIVAIGPFTNLALLAAARPGLLETANVVLMGGWITPPRSGLPPWGPDMDWNVQCDRTAARTVFDAAGELTLVTLPATLSTYVCRSDLDRLRATRPIGRLLARQLEAYAREHDVLEMARTFSGLPDDMLNFQYDVAACAVALGIEVAEVERLLLTPRLDGGLLRFEEKPTGRAVGVTTNVNADALSELWLDAIERTDRRVFD